jgi:hypothetical protein
MVNKTQIEQDLHWYFEGALTDQPLDDFQYKIDEQGLVHVFADVRRARVSLDGKLPVKFGHVQGDFLIPEMNLISLQGAPQTVKGKFDCSNNLLTTLEHDAPYACADLYCSHNKLTDLKYAPKSVNTITCDNNLLTNLSTCPAAIDVFAAYNPFKNFRNTPDHIQELTITYEPDLPLLGLLCVPHVEIFDPIIGEYKENLTSIINKFSHKSDGMKARMLQCAAELIRAGYKGNARW